ncbi:MAG TPA: LA2681 family HEPN domain-containing protein [Arachidicoccus sp.]|nr:LA2681 family HEPN domain-containing protein [Arachidicoccus sp.]
MKNLTNYLSSLLDRGEYKTARDCILKELESKEADQKPTSASLKEIELYGFLIDIGCSSLNPDDIKGGITFMIDKEEEIKNIITPSSYYYNLANAFHGLCKIFYSQKNGVHPISTSREYFQQPIDLYWLAYRNTDKNDTSLKYQIQINLANSLMLNHRIVEAIQILDNVLKERPNLPQAVISRADHLQTLSWATNPPVTIALFAQIFTAYKKGIETTALPLNIHQRCLTMMEEVKQKIISHSFSINDVEIEIKESQKEFENHSPYIKFCIENFLTLNEHSLYCSCIATSKDDIQIGISNAVFKSKLLPKLELLLNRIKSEYAFARWNYYQSFTKEAFDYDVIFSELFEGDVISSQSEALRASFRICYGILDKIALGICKLYRTEGGNIYFERFWEDKARKEILENQRNIHLNALSSIANDLNTKRGELKHFKNWRNKIEHNLLILQQKTKLNLDSYDILEDKDFIAVVDINDFKANTVQLLQLTRAAIFSYVYCVRLETITSEDPASTSAATIGLKQ